MQMFLKSEQGLRHITIKHQNDTEEYTIKQRNKIHQITPLNHDSKSTEERHKEKFGFDNKENDSQPLRVNRMTFVESHLRKQE